MIDRLRCPTCHKPCVNALGLARHRVSCKYKTNALPAPVAETKPGPALPPVRCLDCAGLFPNAIALGQHRTLDHFGDRSLTRSQQNPR